MFFWPSSRPTKSARTGRPGATVLRGTLWKASSTPLGRRWSRADSTPYWVARKSA